MAPEIAQGTLYSKEVDIWSFGCFCYELATGLPPFKHIRETDQLMYSIIYDPVPTIEGNRWSSEFIDFIDLCLRKEPAERYTALELLGHPFLAGFDAERGREAWVNELQSFNEESYQCFYCRLQ